MTRPSAEECALRLVPEGTPRCADFDPDYFRDRIAAAIKADRRATERAFAEKAAQAVENFYPPSNQPSDLSARETATNAALAIRALAEQEGE